MIDSSIYKVYKENQQVFIPEFGAIIQSEVSDSPTFNDMLNFDDGKVVEAIMEKEGIGEDEARTQLQEHVQLIKDKIQEGKTHYVRGLGHIYKDEFGSYAVSKKKPSLDFTAATEAEQPADDASLQDNVPGEFESSLDSTDSFSLDNSTTEEFTIEDPVEPESDFSSLIENADNDLEQNLESEGENQFDLASVNSDDQFNIPEDSDSSDFDQDSENESWNDDNEEYSYDEESFDDDDSYDSDTFYKEEGKGNKVFITLTIVIIVLFAAAAGGYYFMFYDKDDKTADQESSYNTSLASSKSSSDKKASEKASSAKAADTKKAVTTSASPSTSKPVGTRQVTSGDGPYYSVILGSFKVENNANNFQKYLRNRGMEVAIFRRDNDFHFVGFEDIPGKSNAVGVLSEIRQEEPTAWVIRKLGQ